MVLKQSLPNTKGKIIPLCTESCEVELELEALVFAHYFQSTKIALDVNICV